MALNVTGQRLETGDSTTFKGTTMPPTCWLLEVSHLTWTLGDEANVLADSMCADVD